MSNQCRSYLDNFEYVMSSTFRKDVRVKRYPNTLNHYAVCMNNDIVFPFTANTEYDFMRILHEYRMNSTYGL